MFFRFLEIFPQRSLLFLDSFHLLLNVGQDESFLFLLMIHFPNQNAVNDFGSPERQIHHKSIHFLSLVGKFLVYECLCECVCILVCVYVCL